jgi:hypothetical protein
MLSSLTLKAIDTPIRSDSSQLSTHVLMKRLSLLKETLLIQEHVSRLIQLGVYQLEFVFIVVGLLELVGFLF